MTGLPHDRSETDDLYDSNISLDYGKASIDAANQQF